MLTEEQRKLLTEFLGECWHEWELWTLRGTYGYNCKKCTERRMSLYGRTFNTGNDLLALKEALVKKGLWYDFLIYTFRDLEQFIAYGNDGYTDDGIAWLIDKDRFPELVAEFMEVKK